MIRLSKSCLGEEEKQAVSRVLDKEYLGWDTDSHVQAFDLWNKKSNFEFNFTYGNFAEQRYLLNHVKSNKGSSILDVGCASATSYRFLKNNLSFQVFHDTKIQGRSGFFKGFDELKFVPGIHGKGGVHFALGAYDQYVTAVEVGVMLDIFLKDVPIMVVEHNKPYFFNLYITLQIGKRS